MVITSAEEKVLTLLVQDPTKEYTIREISKLTKINYRLAYLGALKLEKSGHLIIEKKGSGRMCKINLAADSNLFVYVENLRSVLFQNKVSKIKVIMKQIEKINYDYFTLLIFGSYVKNKQNSRSDLDLLFILPNGTNLNKFESEVKSVLSLLDYKIDLNIISEESFLEMKNQKELNILNETIKNHIILKGGEQYYSLLKR